MKPTAKDLATFRRACSLLVGLARAGHVFYLANDTLCLMSGPSHDDGGRALRGNVVDSMRIPAAGGGDW